MNLQLAQASLSGGKTDDATAKLKAAVTSVTDGDKTKNPTGRAFVLGKALVGLAAQPAMARMTTRGAVGFTDNPSAPYDLYAGIDSAFTVVESCNPACASQTEPYRRQKAWVDLVNHAIELSNSDKVDSAVILAKRSLLLAHDAPYGYMVLAQAAQKKNQSKEAIAYYKQAIGTATDTSQADTRRQLQLALASYTSDLAERRPARTRRRSSPSRKKPSPR